MTPAPAIFRPVARSRFGIGIALLHEIAIGLIALFIFGCVGKAGEAGYQI
jgi:hypothetical protein